MRLCRYLLYRFNSLWKIDVFTMSDFIGYV